MEWPQFFSQLFDLIKTFGSLAPLLKAAGVITVLISLLKVSGMRPIWDWLGWWQPLLAPFLAFVLAVVNGFASETGSFDLQNMLGALALGLTSVGFHEFLDALKKVPKIGPVWVAVVSFLENILGGTAAKQKALQKQREAMIQKAS